MNIIRQTAATFLNRYTRVSDPLRERLALAQNTLMSDFWESSNMFERLEILLLVNCWHNMESVFESFYSECLCYLSNNRDCEGAISDFYNKYLMTGRHFAMGNGAYHSKMKLQDFLDNKNALVYYGFFSHYPDDLKSAIYRIISVYVRIKESVKIKSIFDKFFVSPFDA